MSRRRERFDMLRLYAEMLRRKGLSVADAQRMPEAPEPWYGVLSWNEREESSYRRWFERYVKRTLLVPEDRISHEWFWWALSNGLHRRDGCEDHRHDEARDADLPRSRWLPLSQALVALPESKWPTTGDPEGRRG